MRSGKGPFQFLREIKPISAGSLFYGIPDLSHPFDAYSSPAIFCSHSWIQIILDKISVRCVFDYHT